MLNGLQRVLLGYLVLLFIFWGWLYLDGETTSIYNFLYSFLFSLIPLIGGIVGVAKSKIWGGLNSAVGKALFFISFGLFLWGAGSMVWSYYNLVLNVVAPYPSWADLGFAPSIFFYGLGTYYLSKATGAKYGWRNPYAKILVIVSSLVVAYISYHVLIVVARGGVLIPDGEPLLKAILDIAYPLGDFIALMVGVIVSGLSFKYFGGKYKVDIYSILAGLWVMFVADAIFSYTTTLGIFYNGNFGDLMLTIGLFLLTFGALGFAKLRESPAS